MFLAAMKETTIVIQRVLGAVTIFTQKGSLRLILPKSAAKILHMSRFRGDDDGQENDTTFVLVATNKGLMICPLESYMNDEDLRSTTQRIGAWHQTS